MKYQVIIIGGGPSGLMAAIECEKEGLDYLLLEKKEKVAKKLFLSGGTRCNVTNNLDIDTFINNLTLKNKKFLYPALYTFSPDAVITFFKENGLELLLENNFKYFPVTNKSQSVIDVLLKNINTNRIKTSTPVTSIKKTNYIFAVQTKETIYECDNVIIATGSKSFPKTGSDGFGLKVANDFNISTTDFIPAETHIYSNQVKKHLTDLMGTSISGTTVRIQNTKHRHTGDLLFTHFGLSGPAIYHLSEFIYEESLKTPVTLEFALTSKQEYEVDDVLNRKHILIQKNLEQLVTKRLAKKILDLLNITNKKTTEISKKELERIKETLLKFAVKVTSVEKRESAYVNKGGINLNELHPHSMESKKVESLYFTGETTNIHGPIGGYNITIAFATGKLAALDISEKYKN